jgi:predicted amidophosphoribosyltransferase
LTSLERTLAAATSELFAQLNLTNVSAVITPARNPKNFRKRGFDPAPLLAKRALQINQVRIPVFSLSNARARADQRGLGRLEREANVTGSMALRQKTTGEVVLFDDVLTTGSTVREMARACEAAGVKVAFCCVLAQKFSDS